MLDALLSSAEAAYEKGDLEEASRRCRDLLRQAPDNVRALCVLALVLAEQRRPDEALASVRRAIALAPGSAGPHYALGQVWQAADRFPEAEASYREAARLDPRHARAHNNAGVCMQMLGRIDEAVNWYRKALEIDSDLPQANQNYSAFVRDPRAQRAAIDGYRRRIAENPRDVAALVNLAKTCVDLDPDEALACLDRAIAAEPEHAEAHFCRAQLLLQRGEYARGWREYEWRWRMPRYSATLHRFPQPVWNGSALGGETILVHGETGLGDMLQFVRYAPLVAERGGRVVVECQPALRALLRSVEGVAQVVAQGEPLPSFGTHVPLIMLPGLFGTRLENVPWRGPYIRPDAERIAAWRPLVESEPAALKVGLVWAGNPANWADSRRSVPSGALAPLARVPDAAFFSLQVGKAAAAMPPGLRFVDQTSRIRDFADTAALMSLLDVVVAVDTSVAHLGGAMAVPTWVLLAFASDWRYHLRRSDNPWYPSMRLFRQPGEGDWAGAVEDLVRRLTELR